MLRHHRPPSGEKTTIDPRVEALLSAAAAPSEAGRLPGEEGALAAFRAARPMAPAHRRTLTTLKRSLAAAVGAGVLLTGGVAAAVTGSLPGAAQDTATGWLEQVGVDVPGADERAGTHLEDRGPTQQADAPADLAESESVEPDAAEHGRQVSDLAKDTEESGADKGAAISEEASEGRSHAGDEHPGGTDSADEGTSKGTVSEAGETHARVDVPNHGAAAGDRKGGHEAEGESQD